MIGWFLVVAIVGGTVHPVDGPPIENGTVIIEDGKVTRVGANLKAPAGARVIDATGKVVTPGLIDAHTGLGLTEVWGAEETRDNDAGGDHPVRAAHRAVDNFNPDSVVIPVQRAHGITGVIAAPDGGLISGQAALYPLAGDTATLPTAAIVVNLGQRRGGSRGAMFGALREVLDDARAYAANGKAFERNQLRRLAAHRLDLAALGPVVRGELPLLVRVNRRIDIVNLLALAEEQKLRIILAGAAEAWMVAEQLAAAKVPVIIDPVRNAPSSFDALRSRADAARILREAGVDVALSTFSTHNVRKLRQWAGNAVRAGLPHPEALAAVTLTPASIFGLSDRGVIKAGAVADIVVWSGDPFELSTVAEHVFIDGRATPRGHRQRALMERYRTLPERPEPAP